MSISSPTKLRNQNPGYGYRLLGSKGNRRRVADGAERSVMERIVEYRRTGASWSQIASRLFREGVEAKTGREWSPSRVRRGYLAALELASAETNGPCCPDCGESLATTSTTSTSPARCGPCNIARRKAQRQAASHRRTAARARLLVFMLREIVQVPYPSRTTPMTADEFAIEFWAVYNRLPPDAPERLAMLKQVMNLHFRH